MITLLYPACTVFRRVFEVVVVVVVSGEGGEEGAEPMDTDQADAKKVSHSSSHWI